MQLACVVARTPSTLGEREGGQTYQRGPPEGDVGRVASPPCSWSFTRDRTTWQSQALCATTYAHAPAPAPHTGGVLGPLAPMPASPL